MTWRTRAQGRVQHRAPFAAIDRLAGEHRARHARDIDRRGQGVEGGERAAIDELLGQIEVHPGGLEREALAAAWIAREQVGNARGAQAASLAAQAVMQLLYFVTLLSGRDRR